MARTVGTAEFGRLLVIERRQPAQPVLALLSLWPQAREVFLRPYLPGTPEGYGLPDRYWPTLLGLVGAQCLDLMKEAVPPGLAASIFVQCALFAAKVDPETFDAGRWQLTPDNGVLHVARLHPNRGMDPAPLTR